MRTWYADLNSSLILENRIVKISQPMGVLCVKKNDLFVEKNDFGIGTRRTQKLLCMLLFSHLCSNSCLVKYFGIFPVKTK